MDPLNKAGFYAHDLWNIRYLPKFKWHHLTEKVAADARARQDKMRAELSQAKKETNFYMKKVDQAKAIEAMEERKRKRAEEGGSEAPAARGADKGTSEPGQKRRKAEAAPAPTEAAAGEGDGLAQVRRRFKQRKVARDRTTDSGTDDVLGMLGGR